MTALDIPHEVLQAIDSVLDYMWHDEATNFWATPESLRERHICRELRIIRCWLTQKNKTIDKSFHTVARSANKVLRDR